MNITRFAAISAWILLAFVIFSTVSPIGMRPHDFLPVQVDRALAFFLLSAAFILGYPKHWVIIGAACIASAFAIEALQFLSATRHPQILDASAKAVGAALGVSGALCFNAATRLIRTRQR
jgi:VanZ family protein